MRIWHTDLGERQDGSERSYIGGLPMLPIGLEVPIFDKTSTQMTFFFQIELPPHHHWAGHIVSVFAATDFIDDDSHIPKLPQPLAGAALDRAFFEDYESFFRLFVFSSDAARMAAAYTEKVAFRRLRMSEDVPHGASVFGHMDAAPAWVLDDESPGSFDGRTDLLHFLFQTHSDYAFATVAGAPREKKPDYTRPAGSLVDSCTSDYTLFVSDELFFFGIDGDTMRIYVVPQS